MPSDDIRELKQRLEELLARAERDARLTEAHYKESLRLWLEKHGHGSLFNTLTKEDRTRASRVLWIAAAAREDVLKALESSPSVNTLMREVSRVETERQGYEKDLLERYKDL